MRRPARCPCRSARARCSCRGQCRLRCGSIPGCSSDSLACYSVLRSRTKQKSHLSAATVFEVEPDVTHLPARPEGVGGGTPRDEAGLMLLLMQSHGPALG